MNAVLVASVLGGLLAVENRSSMKLLLSQPLCGGTLTGAVLGAPAEGLLAGALLQMMFLGLVPLRGERIPDLPLGGVASAALYIFGNRVVGGDPTFSGLVLFWSVVFALLAGALGQLAYTLWEGHAWSLTEQAIGYANRGKIAGASAVHLSAILVHFLCGFLVLAAVLSLGRGIIAFVTGRAGSGTAGSLNLLYLGIPFIGLGHVVRQQYFRTRVFWFGCGFLVVYVFYLIRG